MKWLEGWFGTASGVLGIVSMTLAGLLTSVSAHTSEGTCSTNGNVTTCFSSYGPGAAPVPSTPTPNIGLLVIFGATLLLFVGVLVGTWLDLRGARNVGRIILLVSVTLLPYASFGVLSAIGAPGGLALMLAFPMVLLALVAGVLACVRPDAPRGMAPTT